MRTLLPVMLVAAAVWLDAASANAAECPCDQLSEAGCSEVASIEHAPAPPLWCERSDDPRCMPAHTHGSSANTLVPVVMSWAQSIRWDAPPRTGVHMDVDVEGEAYPEHSRRIERPPR